MRAGFIIPVYNHGSTLKDVLASVLQYRLPVIIVDDGNDSANATLIDEAAQSFSSSGLVYVVRRPKNGGKGLAMRDGVLYALSLSLTHAFQVDADGQHDISACGTFLNAAESEPEALISGIPVYDESVPLKRKRGRKISTAWVHVATLDKNISDALCGFRIYPLAAYKKVLDSHAFIDSRMGYDADILVHLKWEGVAIRELPVRVSYPKDGVSNFRMVGDNIRISLMFARLTLGMIVRLPLFALRAIRRRTGKSNG